MATKTAPRTQRGAPPLIYAFAAKCGCQFAWVDGTAAPVSLDAWHILADELMCVKHSTLRGTGIAMARIDDQAQAVTCIGAVLAERPCLHRVKPSERVALAAAAATAKGWDSDEVRDLYLRNPLVIGGIRQVA